MINLQGRTAVVFGVANKRSIAWAIAQKLQAAGVQLAITYQNERLEQEAKGLIEDLPGAEAFRCDVSVYSLIALARAASPLMIDGGSIMTLTYYGAEKVVPRYNVMGVAKAALEASVRYLSYDLGRQKIRVNAISAGPIKTLAARGISGLGEMLKSHAERSPLQRNVEVSEVGDAAVFLASDLSTGITGETIYVDCGYNIMGF